MVPSCVVTLCLGDILGWVQADQPDIKFRMQLFTFALVLASAMAKDALLLLPLAPMTDCSRKAANTNHKLIRND